MKLLTGDPAFFARGTYAVRMTMTSGASKLQWKFLDDAENDDEMGDITGSELTATGNYEIDLPNCNLQSIITGDGEVFINRVQTSGSDFS